MIQFHKQVQPLLEEYCYDCHADGANKGGVAFDELTSDAAILNRDLWFKVLKNIRGGLMPPARKARPSFAGQQTLERWIKYAAFAINAKAPDPGRVTLRRLNRVEYRNTIRDLLGVDYNTELEFPPDDTGYGFDDIGDVLTVSPMLLEKYLDAARTIIAKALPEHPHRFFTKGVPQDPTARRAYARELLGQFVLKAFRRPPDERTLDRLVGLAQATSQQPGNTFETGIAQALVAVLASPRFLFRIEQPENAAPAATTANVDEYSLASRLSYFLWSTMPDDELLRLAGAGELRAHLKAQVARMLANSRSKNFIEDFTGQWLRVRDLDSVTIDAGTVLARDRGQERLLPKRGRLARPRFNQPELDVDLREAMKRETEMYFGYVVHADRPVTELIESDYTFLDEKLANLYGVTNVFGSEMRRVALPAGSPRGGLLTAGSTLVITSNPDRASPVKRGQFILENFLGMPAPPPPPKVPALEAAEKQFQGREPTLRETLQAHRQNPTCASCHDRMDPIGLAFENFNAMGVWREKERNQAIDPSGKLITGESFKNARELKHILATQYRSQFYRCLAEKLLTYAIGRGLKCYDVETVDQIVERLKNKNGRFSALLDGVIESAPFQRMRTQAAATASGSNDEKARGTAAQPINQNQRNS